MSKYNLFLVNYSNKKINIANLTYCENINNDG